MKACAFLLALGLLSAVPHSANSSSLGRYGSLPEFSLTDQNGQTLSLSDLKGRVWIADFIFTRCQGPCPILTVRMADLGSRLPPDVRLISFTVDPEHDSPAALKTYAESFKADFTRWSFLTGDKPALYGLFRRGFHIAVDPDPDPRGEGDAFIHSQKFVLVDARGEIRRYYDGEDPADLRYVLRDARLLRLEAMGSFWPRLPLVNSALNALSALALLCGFAFIRAKDQARHRAAMLAAFFFSALFLVSYLLYHWKAGSVPFVGPESARRIYFAILLSHSVLAALIVPLALGTLYPALRGDFVRHPRIARWALPVWLYVSVTGVAVYVMAYRL